MADKNYSRELFYKALRKSATLGYNPQDVADLYSDQIKSWQNEWDLHTQKFPHQHFYDKVKNSVPMGLVDSTDEYFVKLVTKKTLASNVSDVYYLYKFYDKQGNLGYFFHPEDYTIELGDCFLFEGTVESSMKSQYDEEVMTTKFKNVSYIQNYGKPDDK